MDTKLTGKVVLITGAASGIGRATAEAFAREGARLALIDIDTEGLAAVKSELADLTEVSTAAADLSTADGVGDGIAAALADYDGVDVLFNNVGDVVVRTFDDLTDEEWLGTFELNFLSQVRALRAVLPMMREAGAGSIVNLSSDLARQPIAAAPHYSASKASILTMTKTVSITEGPTIRVNAVAPGIIWSNLWEREGGFADVLSAVHGMPRDQAVEKEIADRNLPLARMGRPEEVANVVVFLASDLASFVTGSTYAVDGGAIRSVE